MDRTVHNRAGESDGVVENLDRRFAGLVGGDDPEAAFVALIHDPEAEVGAGRALAFKRASP